MLSIETVMAKIIDRIDLCIQLGTKCRIELEGSHKPLTISTERLDECSGKENPFQHLPGIGFYAEALGTFHSEDFHGLRFSLEIDNIEVKVSKDWGQWHMMDAEERTPMFLIVKYDGTATAMFAPQFHFLFSDETQCNLDHLEVECQCPKCEGEGNVQCESCLDGMQEVKHPNCRAPGCTCVSPCDPALQQCEECEGTCEVECDDCEGLGGYTLGS